MATFVLVHGAWHGGWCYKRVAARLRAAGHEVFCPTLTGVGERSHLLSPGVSLSTHVADIANLLRWEELDDVVLAGHSYGGMVITGAADRVADRIRAMVYVDAFVPDDGQAVFDFMTPERRTELSRAAEIAGGYMAPTPAERFAVNAADRAWIDRQCTPHPVACFSEKLRLAGAGDAIKRHHYVLADGWDPSPFRAQAEKVKGREGWTHEALDCGHDIMVDKPDELAESLLGAAA